ncbi:MAG: glycosyltransferase family 4 protein [Acidimicrobiales bacterium]
MSLALLLGPQLAAFVEAGYEVIGASAPGHHVEHLAGLGVRHVPVRHATRAVAPHHDLAALFELWSLFRRLRPAIVHTHNPKPGLYGRWAARAAGVPAIVNTVHGLYAQPGDRWAKRTIVYGLERTTARCSHAELVQNPEDVAVLKRLGVAPQKLILLGNGIDLSRFDRSRVRGDDVAKLRRDVGAGPGDVVCTVVGRLVAEKGYREVFTAASSLSVREPRVRMVVVGPPEIDKRDAITAAEIEGARRSGIRFFGFRDDLETIYAASDVYVLASHREGFPRSAMEAAAMGLPVIATDIRGCREVVDHERTGLLVPPMAPGPLADAIARLAGDPTLRARFGAEGVLKARRDFDQRRVIEITLETYDRLLAAPVAPVAAPT